MAEAKRICSIEGCGKRHYARGWCDAHYRRWKRNGDPLGGKAAPAKNRVLMQFLHSLIASPPEECVIWPFNDDGHGYGRVSYKGLVQKAHRVSLLLSAGEPPTPSHQAAHAPIICHNRACVNPRHLRWATPQENAADRNADSTVARGERQGHAKLTAEDVLAIRRADETQEVLASRYEVDRATISAAQRRRNWAWLDDAA